MVHILFFLLFTLSESEEDKVYRKPFLKTHNALLSAAKGIIKTFVLL